MPHLDEVCESMNTMLVNNSLMTESKVESDSSVLLLPSLSAHACPITVVRGNSSLTKRMSYSENLKERSFQLPKPNLFSNGSVEESSFENICATVIKGDEYSDGHKRPRSSLNGREKKFTPSASSSCADVNILRHNSFKECQQIISRIQQKFSNRTLRKSSSNETKTRHMTRPSHKLESNVGILLKNDIRTNDLHNCKRCKKKQSGSNKSKRKINKEKEHHGKRHNIGLQNIYLGTLKNDSVINDKQMHRKEIPLQKSNGRERDCVVTEAPILKSVYYSEKQSLNVENIPGVPPSTPNEMICNGVASLSDIKSQRCVQQKLQDIRDKQKKKERAVMEAAKAKELEEKLIKKRELMEIQRRQIYAINKVLGDVENEIFLKFKTETQGVPV